MYYNFTVKIEIFENSEENRKSKKVTKYDN